MKFMMVWFGIVLYGMVWHSLEWSRLIWYAVIWCCVVPHRIPLNYFSVFSLYLLRWYSDTLCCTMYVMWHTASFGQGAYMDFSLERPDAPHPVLSKYDKKLRANSKSELPQKKRDKDHDKDRDKDKEESQLRLSSLTTDLTSCRGIGEFLPSFLQSILSSSSSFPNLFCYFLLLPHLLLHLERSLQRHLLWVCLFPAPHYFVGYSAHAS